MAPVVVAKAERDKWSYVLKIRSMPTPEVAFAWGIDIYQQN